jgi:hypothetical protein
MLCKHCGAENSNKSRFCANCAMPLDHSQAKLVCSNCGTENVNTAKFCSECAEQLGGKSQPKQQPKQQPRQQTKTNIKTSSDVKKPIYKRVWFWLLIVFVVIPFSFIFFIGMLVGIVDVASEGSIEEVTQIEKRVDKELESLVKELDEETQKVVEIEEEKPKEPKYVVTVDKLMEDLRSNALKASNTYKDEYIELTGVLSTIDSSGKYITLREINNEWAFITVTCNISSEHFDSVMEFEKGQKMTVFGTITSVGEVLGYSLKVDKIK